MEYRIGYHFVKIRETTMGYRGKPLKKPRKRCQFIHLTESIEAQDINEALKKGLERAEKNQWILEEVSEV